jgi:heme-degrading monooxygenase HmoA
MMIMRVYHARVRLGQEAEFERLVRADAVPRMRQAGMLALHIRRELGGAPEFIIVSLWPDLEALKAFTGEHWQEPVVLHKDAGVLERTWVKHYLESEEPYPLMNANGNE